jgi:serine protease Do
LYSARFFTKEESVVMKRSLTLCITLLLAGSSVAPANAGSTDNCDQEATARPRRVSISDSGFLGVDLGEVTRESASRLRLGQDRGALITRVISESSAAKAGLQKDDVIVKWNGEAIESASELSRHIRETPAGRNVRLGVIRNGSESEIAVTLGDRADYLAHIRAERASEGAKFTARPARVRVEWQNPDREMRLRIGRGYRMGVSLQSMSPQLAEYFGLVNRNGALVGFVHPDSAAAKAGIKAGDVILSVGGRAVEYPLNIHQILQDKSEGPVEVKVMRDKKERTFTVQLEAEKVSSWDLSTDDLLDLEVHVPAVVVPRVAVTPQVVIPRVVVPRVAGPRIAVPSIAPLAPFKYRFALPALAPMARPLVMPKITIPKMNNMRIKIPPLKLVMPLRMFLNPV